MEPPVTASPALPVHAQTWKSSEITRGSEAWSSIFGVDSGMGERTALSLSAVYACVQLLAGAIGTLPLHVYRRDREGDLARIEDPVWWILNEAFCDRWQAAAAWEFVSASILLRGDGFAEILRTQSGVIRGLVPIHPGRVEVRVLPDGSRLIYDVASDPTIPAPQAVGRRILDQDDMLHIPGFGFDGVRGLSPMAHHMRMVGGTGIAMQEYAASFFRNSARPDFALQTDGTLTQEQIDDLRSQLDMRHQGPMNAARPMVLLGGLKVQTLTMPLEEMQLLESRRFQVEEIARVFGVPPFMIGHSEKVTSWGSGVEAMGIGFVRYSLSPWLRRIENEINRKFFPRTTRRVVLFDTTELERADTKSLFEAMRIALGRAGEPAFMTRAEVRRKVNLPAEAEGEFPETTPAAAPAPATPTEETVR